jgi:hypothetical protein
MGGTPRARERGDSKTRERESERERKSMRD